MVLVEDVQRLTATFERQDFRHGIGLSTSVPPVYAEGRTVGYRLLVKTTRPRRMPLEIFVYQRKTLPGANAYVDEFYAVASITDLSFYPVGAPDPQTEQPFFRLGYVDLTFRSPSLLLDAVKSVTREVGELVWSLEYNYELLGSRSALVGNIDN